MYQRSHSCGALRASHVGQSVQLAGWVNGYRDFGGLVFIDLRDREGVTQIVFDSEQKEAHEIAARLRNEDVITIEGIVRDRGVDGKGKSLNNPKLATGAIEIKGTRLELLNKGNNPPFTPDDAEKVGEETRLKYRFIDLRRPRMQHILKTRHRVSKIIRDYFDQNGFLEIETPFLCKSTPEGARDFLVPSRLQPGSWYALPQSPQLFKQILMVAGYERYLQIVRCFRDEDPRADRQAEFTQVDLEMSFVEQEDVMKLVEGCIARIWKEVLNVDVPAQIRRMTYADCMDNYGSDRPDLRFGMQLHNISDLAEKVDFGVFKGALSAGGIIKVIAVPGGGAMTRKETDGLAEWSKGFGAKGLAVTKVTATGLDTGIAKFIAPIAAEIIQRTGAKEGDLLCFAADSSKVVHKVLGELRLKLAKERGMIKDGDWQWLWVVDFPAVEWNPDEKRWDSLHHPFTAPLNEDLEKLASGEQKQIETVRSKAYDIVCNGSELGGGSIRIHRPDVQQQIFKLLGISEEDQRVKFGFLLDALKFGAPPHGGLALGLDRVVMHLVNTTNIRDVIAFPKTQNGADLMLDAPGPVDDKQLRELHVRNQLPVKPTAPATPPAQA